MATLSEDTHSGRYRIQFWIGNRHFHKSLKTKKPIEAERLKAKIELTLADIERGRLKLPEMILGAGCTLPVDTLGQHHDRHCRSSRFSEGLIANQIFAGTVASPRTTRRLVDARNMKILLNFTCILVDSSK